MPILYKSTTSASLKKLAIHFLLFVLVVNMSFESVSGDFGNVIISGNSNPNIRGEGNQGVIQGNSNPNIYSINSVLDIKSNSNVHVSGSGNTLTLTGNGNSNFFGNQCNVVAVGNSNLSVLGNGIRVTVSGTSNHVIRPSKWSAEIGSVNKLKISPSFGANTTNYINKSSNSTSDGNSDKFTIDFVDEVVIDQNNYKLGLFVFTIKGSSATGYEVKMDDSEMDEGSLAVNTTDHSEVVLSATKEGVKHQLKVQGHRVKSKDRHEKSFRVKLYAN